MVFSSTVFLFLFLPIVFIIYYNPVIKGRKFRNIFLLCASLFFYGWGEPVFIFLMLLSIVLTWFLGIKIQQNYSKLLLSIGIFYHLLILFVFKYLTFAANQIGAILNKDIKILNLALPIGISFFTFQLMSYLFDIYNKKVNAQKNLLYVGLYASMFPQLIAGPIVRYEEIATEIIDRTESYNDISCGMKRFIYGLSKKVLISNYLAQIVDNCFFSLDGNLSAAMAWLGAICYTLQIYYDFSGYSDMAIGLGRMFGFHFGENFDYPYISKSITEFWRRWHISLSSWFKDYVYIPLGGNRVKKSRWIFNLFIVWLLTGIWHGANWTFIVWGLFYFVFLLIEKITGFNKYLGKFSHIYTMFVVILAWVIFRAESIGSAYAYIGKMFCIGGRIADSTVVFTLKNTWLVIVFAIMGATPILKNKFKQLTFIHGKQMYIIEQLWIVLIFVLSVAQVVGSTYNPFIYFNF